MGKPCACCASAKRGELDAQLLAGNTAKAVAAATGFSASQVGRHKRKCLQFAPLSNEEQLQRLMDRSEELWAMAAANADVRAMAQALQSSLRGLEFSIKHSAEVGATREARDLPLDPQQWTEEEGAKFRAYMDHVMQTTELPAGFVEEIIRHEPLPHRD